MAYAIEVKNLVKSYGKNNVLKGIDFKVESGKVFGILGVNGAGKTTLIECVEGLRRYEMGETIVSGSVGIQLQSSSLPGSIKAIEAVKLFSKWNNLEIDYQMLSNLGVDDIKNKQYDGLSTGQKRRLHLCLALLSNPDIVFLDEPTAGLDVEGRIALHNEILKLKKERKTIILTSHDMAEVEKLCDEIMILKDGKISFLGRVDELSKRYNVVITTSDAEKEYSITNIEEELTELLAQYKSSGQSIVDIKVNRGSLENHFVSFTKESD